MSPESPLLSLQLHRSLDGSILATFTCPFRCGHGFGNYPADEAARKAVWHAESCRKKETSNA